MRKTYFNINIYGNFMGKAFYAAGKRKINIPNMNGEDEDGCYREERMTFDNKENLKTWIDEVMR